MHYKKINLLPLILAVFLILSLCRNLWCGKEGLDKNLLPNYGDAIIIGSIGEPRTLVPILASDSASADICSMIFNGLVKYDKDLNIVGDLAESWEILEEGKVLIFHLRPQINWHDGYPFSAEDVQFTYKKLIDPNVRTPYSGDFERIDTLEVIDNWTVKITYKAPFSPALSSWGMFIMPKHLLEKEDLNKTEFARQPQGTGPYRFKEWKTQEKIELVSNHDYFEGRPYIDRYIYRIIPDQSTLFLELQTQGLDYIGLTPLQYIKQTETLFFKKNFQKFYYPSFSYTYIGYNLNNPKFNDIRVRQAINYALNKEEIIKGVLLGLGRVCTGPFPPESWAYNKDVTFLYNPQKAKDLLREAGWQERDNGYLEKDGKEFEFTLMTNQGNEQRQRTAELIQRRLAEIGIRMKIRIVEWSTFINEFINKRRFEAVLLGWSLSREPDCFDIWHSSKTKEGEFNFINYKNEELDRLLEEGRRVFDLEKRKEIYHNIHRILYEEQPYTFLYVPDSLPIIHARFRGIEVAPIGIGHNFIKWFVPLEEQRY